MESSKTEILSFDEWYKEAKKLNDDGFSAKDFFEAGQQSKQAEVDELQKRVKELELINFDSELHFDAAKEHIDCLQKRIDRAVEHIEEWYGVVELSMVVDILNGDQS